MRILVTGGAGYVGSILVPQLLRQHHAVTVVDTFQYGSSLLDVCHEQDLTIVRADVCDVAIMQPLIRQADAIVPLAAIVGAPACAQQPARALSVNVTALAHLVNQVDCGQIVVYPNTNSGYGTTAPGVVCTEDTPLAPISLYGRLKRDAEEIVRDRCPHATVFRFATLFGISPRMRIDLLVNDFVYRAVTERVIVLFEADFRRNYLHVRDAANAIAWALDHPEMRGEVYNAGCDGANCSKRELCRRIQQHVPELLVIDAQTAHDPDQRNYVVSNAKLTATGFMSQYTLDDGIRELIRGYRALRPMKCVNAA